MIYIIYKIKDNTTNNVYIGHTKQPLKQRIATHKRMKNCKAWDILENDNYVITHDCIKVKDKRHAEMFETIVMLNVYNCVNEQWAYRTKNQKKELILKQRKSKQRIYKCPCGQELKLTNSIEIMINRHKISKKHQKWKNQQEENKEHIPDIILKERGEKDKKKYTHVCECGTRLLLNGSEKTFINRHKNTKKHQKYLNQQKESMRN